MHVSPAKVDELTEGFGLNVVDCLMLCFWQIAQQEAQRAQYIVDKAKQERQQKIVQAEGEATAAKLVSFERCFWS